MGKNGVSAFSQPPLIRSLWNLEGTRPGIKSLMNSNSGRVRLFTTELLALRRSHSLNGENGVAIFSQLLWIQSSIKLTGNKDRHKISDKFKFQSYLTRLIWVIAGRTCHFVGFVTRRLIFGNIFSVSEHTLLIMKIRATSWQNQQNGMCTQRRLRSAWASVSSLSAWRKLGSLAIHWFCH